MVKVDKVRIRRAIEEAEGRTSGEICVALSPFFWGDVWKAAERAFHRLRLRATRERNGVLIFVVPSRHRFVVLGDSGVHQKVGQDFWYRIAGFLSDRLHQGDFTSAIVAGVEAVGEGLAEHFPHRPDDRNELPDIIDERP
ncbi:MAG TPA: TPM domain-containing protein [Rhizomicrobium sp.]|nr:TPM domain-containing protein [Rhizomicrobium sp.]